VAPLVISDSSACVPEPWARHRALRTVPLGLVVGGARVDDHPVTTAAIPAPPDPIPTVAPTPVDYLQVLDGATDGAVVVTPAAAVAVMHRNARLAARLASTRTLVIDSGTAGPAQGLCVVAALQAVDAGGDATAVAEAVHRVAGTVHQIVMVPDLATVQAAVDPVRRRDRQRHQRPSHLADRTPNDSAASRAMGDGTPDDPPAPMPSRVVVATFRDGMVVPLVRRSDGTPRAVGTPRTDGCAPVGDGSETVGGTPATAAPADATATDAGTAMDRLLDGWLVGGGPTALRTVVFHAGDTDQAVRLARTLQARMDGGGPEPMVVTLSAAMAAHTGPHCIGVAWMLP
jgi:fatty acid-binding protein DegV